jgi:ribosome-associated translation inhibitor RaiA
MNIQINAGHNIHNDKSLIAKFSSTIKEALTRMSDHITSVQVHLSDEDGNKKGKNDKRCMLEARLEGRQPIVVTANADTLNQALDGAIDKLIGMIEGLKGRKRHQRDTKTRESSSKSMFS